ncbi:unnamed protein product, partial [Phyllotreta striolata]
MLEAEIKMVEIIFDEQMETKQKIGHFNLDKYMPPVAGILRWTRNLCTRLTGPLQNFKALQHPIVESQTGCDLIARAEKFLDIARSFTRQTFALWAEAAPAQIESNLKKNILRRDPRTKELFLNFSLELTAILREVHYLKLMEEPDIPEVVLKLAERNETFQQYTTNVSSTVTWYNKIKRTSKEVEFNLIEKDLVEIDKMITVGEEQLNWESEALWEYMIKLHMLVGNLQGRLQKCQVNLDEIKNILVPFARQPLFERKEGRKEACLALDERTEKLEKRKADIKVATGRILQLLEENMNLFQMTDKQEDEKWLHYIDYTDKIVSNYLYQSVGCSLGYINEHMEPSNNLPPLFESQLKLMEPNITFIPSLDTSDPDGLKSLITGLINDIIDTSAIVERFSKTTAGSYKEEIQANEDIVEIITDIMSNIDKVVEESYEFCDNYQSYAYLWLDDRDQYLHQFLNYGRQLTNDELEYLGMQDPMAPKPNPPKMEQFREQIDNFENLSNQVETIGETEIFHRWFKVDVRPFKQALLNTIRKWGNMFKDHLVTTVTSSLCDLSNFIRLADEGLQQTVIEGDYQALVNVMGFLLNVKERQVTTDEMFGPQRDIIELLKFYDMDIPEEVNVYLQELPEQWNNTKKIAITVKQQVAPLQAAEVTCIRKRIV